MPNWIYTKLEANEIDKLPIFDKKGNIDFNLIIPEPLTKDKCNPKYFATEESHITKDEERPWFDWYAWHCHYWNTKWNAWDTYVSEDTVEFSTAWTPAIPIFKKISEMLGDKELFVTYSDECYDGTYEEIYKNGKLVGETVEYYDNDDE